MHLATCPSCAGFTPPVARCPHCDAPLAPRPPTTARRLIDVAAGSAIALTLAACYGAAIYPPPDDLPSRGCDPARDVDGDGYCEDDCDQADATVHPGASDPPGDGLDQDCDGFDGPPPGEAPADAVMVERD